MSQYSDWLSTQSDAFQDVALGKRKANQFRKKEINIEKYVEHGKPLSLDDLQATHDLSINGE